MPELFVLFEHAIGFALFNVKEFEEIGMLLPQVEESVTNFGKFSHLIHLVSFLPFKSAVVALENINSLSEGIASEMLQNFLEKALPKKKKVLLGVSDQKLAAAINESLGFACTTVDAVPEIIRGIRYHFPKLINRITEKSSSVAQLGLGHAYSRAKVKFNVNRNDNMVIQSICLIDQLDKDINTFSMRIREWYSYHFPELYKIVPDNYLYAKAVRFIQNRKELSEEKINELEEILMDRSKAEALWEAAKSSMGMDISPIDMMNIHHFANRVIALSEYRQKLINYLNLKMDGIAPNLSTLIGEQLGARLISRAGSLCNLAKFPASTVQILGAEKALFRALKAKSTRTPKYGILFHASHISKADSHNKGRISRYLANKCSIASRIDCFSDIPTRIYGEKLKGQVEDRLKFYQTGEFPEKNINVMLEAAQELQVSISAQKKKKKKNKKRKLENGENINNSENNGTEFMLAAGAEFGEAEVQSPPKKKKKKKSENMESSVDGIPNFTAADLTEEADPSINQSSPKKKKKKSNTEEAN